MGVLRLVFTIVLSGALAALSLSAQATGRLEGHVYLREASQPLGGAEVFIVQLDRRGYSDDDGAYAIENVRPGSYQVIAHVNSVITDVAKTIEVRAGETSTVDFDLDLQALHHEITVTAEGRQVTAFESFQSVDSLDSFDLAEKPDVSLGEALSSRVGSGIAKRSFGPGTSRPIIRGFDGDRVLVMQDGVRVGTLASQSGDHGEPLNMALVDRLEVVKGPATLLYGSNAMGGTVNAISRHNSIHTHAHDGLNASLSAAGGTTNSLASGAGVFEYGYKNWMVWGGGGGVRSGDYDTPIGEIFNSGARQTNANAGFGYYGEKQLFSAEIEADDGRYGVPFAQNFEEEVEKINIDTRRKAYNLNWGMRNLSSAIDNFSVKLRYIDYGHDEVETLEDGEEEVGTSFTQGQFIYRTVFEQAARGPWTGRFGVWGLAKNYDVAGEEALSPGVDQSAFAAFALEELGFERYKLQVGARLETNRYEPQASPDFDLLDSRRFTGVSASAGIHTDLWRNGAFVASYARSYRAPALEELYNNGPHAGNLAFEVGDPFLKAETGNGIDLSLRQDEQKIRGELNFFYYDFANFVFPFDTGEIDDGFHVLEYTQRNARFVGGEASAHVELHSDLWLDLGLDYVNAKETDQNTYLPRIPPLRGSVGFDWHIGELSVKPSLILADRQDRTYTGETETPGYAVLDLTASYSLAKSSHMAHQFSVNVFNVGDALYRNHASFIKDLAPEIGRGVKFSYVVRVF